MDPSENPYAATHFESSTVPENKQLSKPVSAMVFGILHLVFGVPGLLCSPFNFITINMIESSNRPANAALDVMRDTPGYMTYYKGTIIVGVVMAAVLVAAGVGLLKGRPWGRTLSIIYCCVAICLGIGATFAHFYFLYEPLSQVSGPEGTGAMIGGIIGAVIGPIYPIITLIFMFRKNFVEYFNQQ
mgnify:CR=1 FL=1